MNFDILEDMGKQHFFKVLRKNLFFLEMLIFLDIWTKNFFQRVLTKSSFSWNFDISKNDFFSNLKNFPFSRNVMDKRRFLKKI